MRTLSAVPSAPATAVVVGVLLVAGAAPGAVSAQAAEGAPATDGPVVHGYGEVWDIADPALETPLDMEYRVVFDVSSSSEPGTVNPYLNTAARFLNMHARAGVPAESLHVAVVLHGEAAKDALLPGPFRERYGVDNANLELVRALAAAGVEIYMCGQSLMARGLPRSGLAEPVRVALSAMTARAVLQARGYRPVN